MGSLKDDLAIGTLLGTGFGVLYLGATLAVNTLAYGVQAAAEATESFFNPKRITSCARIDETGYWRTPNGGNISFARVTLEDGSKKTLSDSIRVLEGKFLPDRFVRNLETGKGYNLKFIDSIFGNVILDAKEGCN
ncbi:MAG: hypothetical protein ABIB79_05340 [archaeon]